MQNCSYWFNLKQTISGITYISMLNSSDTTQCAAEITCRSVINVPPQLYSGGLLPAVLWYEFRVCNEKLFELSESYWSLQYNTWRINSCQPWILAQLWIYAFYNSEGRFFFHMTRATNFIHSMRPIRVNFKSSWSILHNSKNGHNKYQSCYWHFHHYFLLAQIKTVVSFYI